MSKIGGNMIAEIQVFSSTQNEIGEFEKSWETVQSLKGFLDLRNGESKYSDFDAKIEESTHVFICDFMPLENGVTAEKCRMKICGKIYDIMLIDNPLELNRHYEFYLKFVGGQ